MRISSNALRTLAKVIMLLLSVALFMALIFWSGGCVERRRRVREAVKLTNEVWMRAVAYRRAEHFRLDAGQERPLPTFPVGIAPFEPGPDCGCQYLPRSSAKRPNQKGACPGNDPIWALDPVWRQLRFSITERHDFKVSYEGEADRFVVRVRGDFDCDGVISEFTRTGDERALSSPELFPVERTNEAE